MSRGPPRGYQPLGGGGSGAGLFDRRQQPSPSQQQQYPPPPAGYDLRGIDRRQQAYTPPQQGYPRNYPPQQQPQSTSSASSGFFHKLTTLDMGGRQSGGVFRVGKVSSKIQLSLTRVTGPQSSTFPEESIVCEFG